LRNDHGTGFCILLQQFGNGGFKRVQFADPLARGGRACRGGQVLGNGSTPDVQVTRDLTHRPVFGKMEAMNGVDLLAVQHGLSATYKAEASDAIGMFLSRRIGLRRN
jgi:hypothetical protein